MPWVLIQSLQGRLGTIILMWAALRQVLDLGILRFGPLTFSSVEVACTRLVRLLVLIAERGETWVRVLKEREIVVIIVLLFL